MMRLKHATTAYILHRRPYAESSLLLELFTEDYGRVAVIARGQRYRQGKKTGVIQAFTPLAAMWTGRGELFTLTQAEALGSPWLIHPRHFLSALYLNELLLRACVRLDPLPKIFYYYQQALAELTDGEDAQACLRGFEIKLLAELGYAIDFAHDADGQSLRPESWYYYQLQHGFVKSLHGTGTQILFSGEELAQIAQGQWTSPELLQKAKQLMRQLLPAVIGEKPLQTRKLWRQPIQ